MYINVLALLLTCKLCKIVSKPDCGVYWVCFQNYLLSLCKKLHQSSGVDDEERITTSDYGENQLFY